MRKEYQIWEKGSKGLKGMEEVRLQVPIEEFVEGLREDVEAFAGDAGLAIIERILEQEVEKRIGRRYEHQCKRIGYRSGKQAGYVVYAGRKATILYPRMVGEQGEIPLKSYKRFQRDGRMQRAVSEKVLLGVSQRDYGKAIGDVCEGYGVKRSSVSKSWVKATEEKLKELCERSLSGLSFCALMIDGLEYAGRLLAVVLGVNEEGEKMVLGLWEGATENSEVCQALLEDLVRRGLDTTKNYLVVMDGSKALRKALNKVLGEKNPVQRCQIHKRRNLRDHLPEELQASFDRRIRNAYALSDYAQAKESLCSIVNDLEKINPSAARSLEEGLDETLTLHKLNLPETLRRSLSTTNLIESCFSIVRHLTRNVKHWRKGNHVQRWVASSLLEAEKKFKKVRGYRCLSVLVSALDRLTPGKKLLAA